MDGYFEATGSTPRAVVYGLLLAAVAQGAMGRPGLLGGWRGRSGFLGRDDGARGADPVRRAADLGSIGIWLLASSQTAAGIGLLLWGALAVNWSNNFVRPLVISGVSRIPFLLVLFGACWAAWPPSA